jgi:hypothetical protein
MVEVAVAAVAEAMTGHVDRRAEPPVLEQRREVVALVRVQEGIGDGEAAVVERRAERVPVEGVDAVRERGGGGRHKEANAAGACDVRSLRDVLRPKCARDDAAIT